jgi:hypothetical protein
MTHVNPAVFSVGVNVSRLTLKGTPKPCGAASLFAVSRERRNSGRADLTQRPKVNGIVV